MNSQKLLQLIKNNSCPPIIFLFGEEEFLINETSSRVIQLLLQGLVDEYNFEKLEASQTDLKSILSLADSYPMMSERRLIVVNNFQNLFNNRSKKVSKEQALLEKYLTNPQPTTILLLKGGSDKLKGISKKAVKLSSPYNILIEKHCWIEHPKVYDNMLPRWVGEKIRTNKKAISKENIEKFIAQSEPNLRQLNNEIEKLCDYVGDKAEITLEDINSLSGAGKNYNAFELQKYVGNRNLEMSLEITDKLVKYSKQELMIVSMLTRFFIALWKMLELNVRGENKFSIAGKIGVSPYFFDDYLIAMRKYSSQQIEQSLTKIYDTELALKSTSTSSSLLMQQLIIDIVSTE